MAQAFPFSAIVGQDEMKLAILAAAVDPRIGGVLVFGDRGTGKSTAVRALAALLPKMKAVVGCRYACDPADTSSSCDQCPELKSMKAGKPKTHLVPVPVVDLPLGATEDRVVGALDLEKALTAGVKAFEPGLLARAHRGFLYIDEVNLLEDHLVDLLIDVAASGENVVEREGLSVRHPARFVLVGSGNPEEGELRPQLLDRFGLAVEVRTPQDIASRVEVVRRRDDFERGAADFHARWQKEDDKVRARIVAARKRLPDIQVPDSALERAAQLCMGLGTDGLRGELTLIRAARALAALDGAPAVGDSQIHRVAKPALRHRLRRDPLDDTDASARVERVCTEIFGARTRPRSAFGAPPQGGDATGPAKPVPARPLGGPHQEQVWGDALWVQALLAIAPHGLGGVHLRASAGPVRDRWLAGFRALLPAGEPLRRMPGHIADDRLLGGLDLSATLTSGRPVAQRGLLAESHGGVVVVPMAERLSTANAGRLAAALDSGEVGFERDGISARWQARFGVVACDEGGEDDHPLAPTLLDRLAFHVDLRALSLRDCGPAETRAADAAEVAAARTLLPRVTLDERVLQALCGTALALGVPGLRASQHAVRAARAAAALAGRASVNDDDALLAARLVLAPRATRLPTSPDDADAPAEPPPPPESEEPPPTEEPQPQNEPQTLEDRLVEAAVAVLPAGLLAALQGGLGGPHAGRVGALTASPRSGRPVGTRLGSPRGGARLNLIETLRAAAPWQALRRRAAPRRTGLIHVHSDDLRISRLQQRAATATIFVLDASGSSALHRLGEAKGAVNLLLADCYVRRDQVAVIAFRGRTAELLLPPTRSLVRAKRSLAALPGGGGTPLALGLEAALRLATQVRRSGATPIVVLLTDGRANITRAGEPGRAQAEADAIAMARQLRAARLTALVVDTSPQPAIAAQRLAAEMAAQYRALPYAGAQALTAAVQSLPRKVN